jgi:hypothetical protein
MGAPVHIKHSKLPEPDLPLKAGNMADSGILLQRWGVAFPIVIIIVEPSTNLITSSDHSFESLEGDSSSKARTCSRFHTGKTFEKVCNGGRHRLAKRTD